MITVPIQEHYSFRLDHLLFMYPDLLFIDEYGTNQILIELKLKSLSPVQYKIRKQQYGKFFFPPDSFKMTSPRYSVIPACSVVP
jgi:hypothetical protein